MSKMLFFSSLISLELSLKRKTTIFIHVSAINSCFPSLSSLLMLFSAHSDEDDVLDLIFLPSEEAI